MGRSFFGLVFLVGAGLVLFYGVFGAILGEYPMTPEVALMASSATFLGFVGASIASLSERGPISRIGWAICIVGVGSLLLTMFIG